MTQNDLSNGLKEDEKEYFWGKYVEIKLKNNRIVRGLVIAQAGDSISISDEFKNLEEYTNYKPQIMGSCSIIYPHTEGYKWDEIVNIEVLTNCEIFI